MTEVADNAHCLLSQVAICPIGSPGHELQQSYDLAYARLSAPHDPVRETRAHLFGKLPVTEMIERGKSSRPVSSRHQSRSTSRCRQHRPVLA
ncbi:hypothetical protein [Bradyrhizobium acaciae]|uniref:hypothetical protein n=1 Tax=Bradyrhizobium acaciae TaxID=2683706 RepID=UPI001E46CAF4|nr:hypothetical protein [Bradyrhizobium acaciae]MCC8977882.1 hypothetical protein [Bradyrhizobium acaciae]